MCAIAKSLADEESWEDAFETERDARDKKEELALAFDELKVAVKLAIQGAQARFPAGSNDRTLGGHQRRRLAVPQRAEGRSRATRLQGRRSRDALVRRRGEGTIGALRQPRDQGGACECDRGGTRRARGSPDRLRPLRASASAIVIVDRASNRRARPALRGSRKAPPSGHGAAAPKARRPRQSEAGGVRVLASAAPGTDIICHELCHELGVKSTICLPMPVDAYSTETFNDLDAWRSRFLDANRREGRSLATQRLVRSAELAKGDGRPTRGSAVIAGCFNWR